MTSTADDYRPNPTFEMKRAVRVDIELPGGQVRLELDEPTPEQLTAVLTLLETWLQK
jgi:hypothetical protein